MYHKSKIEIIMSEKIRYLVRRAFNSMKEEPYDVDMAWKRKEAACTE